MGSATSSQNFIVTPTITDLSALSGLVGAPVTIDGYNFTHATRVTFNGTPATFTITNPTRIDTSVPSGATTGPITLTAPEGTGTSPRSFAVSP